MTDSPTISLVGIHLYPVKGCAGLSLGWCTLDSFGIVHDRRWMVVDEEGVFLSQRTRPRMALVRPRVAEGTLSLEAPDMPDLCLPVDGADGEEMEVSIWEDRVRARVVGSGAGEWITEFLGQRARLVHMGNEEWRGTDPSYAEGSRVGFADGYPLHLVSEESLAELNGRMEEPIPLDRFRPNLVVRSGGAYEEDGWRRLRIGDVEMEVVKPCARCTVITVDQSRGVARREPLATLSRYRGAGGKVYFGQNVVHREFGRLEVGQRVEVLEVGSPRPLL